MPFCLQHIQSFVNQTWLGRYEVPVGESTNTLLWSFIVSTSSLGGLVGAIHCGSLSVKYGRWDEVPPLHSKYNQQLLHTHTNPPCATHPSPHPPPFKHHLYYLHSCRKTSLQINNVVAILAAVMMVLSRMAKSFEMILLGRFLFGYNSGMCSHI